jgi:outer membrane receptor protein involved in Fe transport
MMPKLTSHFAIATCMLSGASHVGAEAVASPAASGNTEVSTTQEIIVTGSRLTQKGFDTPTPVTAISAAELRAKAPVTVNDIVRDIPSLRPNLQNSSSIDVGISTFNLRGLGAQRTLTLIDGHRALNTSPASGFDTNTLPAALISRVEIVTAGASSVYGSDAVAGVVNIFLDSKLTGFRVSGEAGVTQRGDNASYNGSIAYGRAFDNDRGHFVLGGSIYRKPDVVYTADRAWGTPGWTLLSNAAYTPTNDQPRLLQAPDGRLATMTAGGLITSAGPLQFIQFGAGGAQSVFQRGTNISGVYMQGGDGERINPGRAVLSPKGERDNLYGRLTYDIGSDTEAFVEGLYARSLGADTNVPNYNNSDIVITRDNAYLPANIRAAMVANNLTTIRMGRINYELGINYNTTEFKYLRGATGIKGKFLEDWKWDAGFSYTKALLSSSARHNRNNANWTNAIDSVVGPNGQAICRSTLTNPNNGCVPVNLFGTNSITQPVIDYVTGTSTRHGDSRQLDAQVNISGNVFSTWAGPVSVAFGAEYRRETVDFTTDPISAVLGWRQTTQLPYSGAVNVKEGYVETSIPLATDLSWAKDIHVDAAARVVHYSTSGSAFVWKVSGNYSVNDAVRFRGTYSRDFRAPTINELFAAPTAGSGAVVIDRLTGATTSVTSLTGGNPQLKPERAQTKTFGVILKPGFLPHLQFSVDYFDIRLKDAITTIAVQDVEDRCFAGDQLYCAFITRNSVGVITSVSATSFNAQQLKTNGIDFELQHTLDLNTLREGWNGSLHTSVVASYVAHLKTITNGVAVDTAGQLQGTGVLSPHWRGTLTMTYNNGPFTVRLNNSLVGPGKYNASFTAKDINRNNYPAFVFTDLNLLYDIRKGVQVYAKVENLLDTDPPIMASNETLRANSAGLNFYPLLGRTFAAGFRLSF